MMSLLSATEGRLGNHDPGLKLVHDKEAKRNARAIFFGTVTDPF